MGEKAEIQSENESQIEQTDRAWTSKQTNLIDYRDGSMFVGKERKGRALNESEKKGGKVWKA